MKTITIRIGLIVLFAFASAQYKCQDTLSVYFQYSDSEITSDQLAVLDSIKFQIEYFGADSLRIVGMTDSLGDFQRNVKLSGRRAQNVAFYCRKYLPSDLPVSLVAAGENQNSEKESRRVDVIIFNSKELSAEHSIVGSPDTDKKCYSVDYTLLSLSNIRTFNKGKKELVYIQVEKNDLKASEQYYFGSNSAKSEFRAIPVKWSLRVTGNFWWAKERYTATIALKDFESYKIFTISDLPCDSCSEDFATQPVMSHEDSCIGVDYFVMKNAQYRLTLFDRSVAMVKVPKEYIDLSYRYFLGCDSLNYFKWKVKRGKKNENYYYAKIKKGINDVPAICRLKPCCKALPKPFDCNLKCGSIRCQ